MLQKYINSKQKPLKQKILHFIYVIFQKILQFIILKKKTSKQTNKQKQVEKEIGL